VLETARAALAEHGGWLLIGVPMTFRVGRQAGIRGPPLYNGVIWNGRVADLANKLEEAYNIIFHP
jgi:hypothetical protein